MKTLNSCMLTLLLSVEIQAKHLHISEAKLQQSRMNLDGSQPLIQTMRGTGRSLLSCYRCLKIHQVREPGIPGWHSHADSCSHASIYTHIWLFRSRGFLFCLHLLLPSHLLSTPCHLPSKCPGHSHSFFTFWHIIASQLYTIS